MKKRYSMVSILLLVGMALGAEPNARFKTMASARFQWLSAGAPFSFVLEYRRKDLAEEPRFASARLRILRDGRTIAAFWLRQGVANFRKELEGTATHPANLIQSSYLLFSRLDEHRPPFIFLWGPGDGTGPGAFYGFSVDESGTPHKVLDLETFDFWKLEDIDGDGGREIVGRETLAEAVGATGDDAESYDPIWILKPLPEAPWTIKRDEQLTERYNRQHYVWAGPRYDERYVVVRHGSGRFELLTEEKFRNGNVPSPRK